MKKIVLCLSLLLIASSLGVAKDKDKDKNSKDNSATDQKLIDLEKSMWEAWKNQDRKPFDENLAPNFVGVDSGGMNDKTGTIGYITSKCNVKDYSLSDSKVTWLDKDAALLTYKANQHATCDGKASPENIIASSVFVKQNGKWWESFHSEVPVQEGQAMGGMQH